jgi:hypothetical protein
LLQILIAGLTMIFRGGRSANDVVDMLARKLALTAEQAKACADVEQEMRGAVKGA